MFTSIDAPLFAMWRAGYGVDLGGPLTTQLVLWGLLDRYRLCARNRCVLKITFRRAPLGFVDHFAAGCATKGIADGHGCGEIGNKGVGERVG